jgi:hypothetical protein
MQLIYYCPPALLVGGELNNRIWAPLPTGRQALGGWGQKIVKCMELMINEETKE